MEAWLNLVAINLLQLYLTCLTFRHSRLLSLKAALPINRTNSVLDVIKQRNGSHFTKHTGNGIEGELLLLKFSYRSGIIKVFQFG